MLEGVLGAGTEGDRQFSGLADVVSEQTLKAVQVEMGFTEMMEIQFRCIRPLLEGRWETLLHG